jgi:outer membrane protein OmpA-like peptidoglycan-associated protein
MAFESRGRGAPYRPQEGDTLEKIADRARAEGHQVTWQEVAIFNFGTDDPEEVEAFKRDQLGCRYRNQANEMVISEDEPRARQLVVPLRFEGRRGLSVDRPYQLRIRKKECPKQFLACASFPAITFGTASSFIRPSVAGQLVHLEGLFKRHPDSKVIVFGHTDAIDDELFNKKLGERRAWSAHAFITKDAQAWETLYHHDSERWGVPVLQEILTDLGFDPGETSAALTETTRQAMRDFLGLPSDASVDNDVAFRQELFLAYMNGKHAIKLPPDCFMDPGYMGCGEFNPVLETEEAFEGNRRVTFYFFHKDRLPTLPCRFADTAPCENQFVSPGNRHKSTFRCSFYDSLSCHCKRENIPLVTTFRIVLATYHGTRSDSLSAHDWFQLTSKDGSYDETKPASDAVVHDGKELRLDFQDVETHHRFTLRHFSQGACWTVFHDKSYLDLVELELKPPPGKNDEPDAEEVAAGELDVDFPPEGAHLISPLDEELGTGADDMDAADGGPE